MQIESWPIEQIKPYPQNARKISQRAIDKVAKSLLEFGWQQPIVVDKQGVIVAGHTRRLAALQLGWTHCPVHIADKLTPEQIRQYRLMDNRSNEEAIWDDDLLKLELGEMKGLDLDLSLTGFEIREINGLMPVTINEDEVPEAPVEVVTRPGDLWVLGDHRLLCGDSTNAEDVARLMAGRKAGLMNTDPPYGVNYDASWRSSLDSIDRATNAFSGDDNADWSAAYRLFDGDVAYVWHAGLKSLTVAKGLSDAGFELRGQIIWRKPHFVISRGHYHSQHEPCWYAVRVGATASWQGDRTQSSVWEADNKTFQAGAQGPEDERTGHSSQKPVDLMGRPIKNHTTEGGSVYDPFSGSGSTLIAAEQLNRKCYGLEIEPRYCDVIILRWQNLTGRKAIIEGHGTTYEQARDGQRHAAEDAIKEEVLNG